MPLDPLLEFLLREDRAERLLAEHVDDGGQCAVCAVGGQHGRVRWPCSIAVAASRALALLV